MFSARWISERDVPPPAQVVIAHDDLKADDAYGLACQGSALLWRGDFQNARQLLTALGNRATFEAVFSRTALTALVKCEAAADKTAKLPSSTATTCAQRHLAHELAYFRPAYVLALG